MNFIRFCSQFVHIYRSFLHIYSYFLIFRGFQAAAAAVNGGSAVEFMSALCYT